MPWLIRGLKIHGILVRDYYKRKKTYIPREGGMVLLFASTLMITIFPVIILFARKIINDLNITFVNIPDLNQINYFVVLVILMFGLFGMMDDYLDISRPMKVLIPLVFLTPIIFNFAPDYIWFPIRGYVETNMNFIADIKLKSFYRFLIIPLYIIVVSNLINMHSGFNGLQSGLSSIILTTLLIKSIVDVRTQDIIAIGGLTGAIIALWFFNKYPAQIFEGNTGSLMIGAGIGLLIIIQGYHFAGFVMLIPHTVNFLMYVNWRIQHRLKPDDPKYKIEKFGRLRPDGTLRVPNNFTLKWVIPYRYRLTEKQAVLVMYLLTIIFCIIGFFVPG